MGVGQGSRRNYLNTQEAFAAYEAVRHRLPNVSHKGACKHLPDLDAIAEEIDVFLLDAFGVLNIGETAIAGVPERIAGLQKAGKRVMIVSNAAGFPHARLMEKYQGLGYQFAPEDVITSRKATLFALQSAPAHHWGLMANETLGRADLERLNATYLADDRAVYDAVDAFLLIGSGFGQTNGKPCWRHHFKIALARSMSVTLISSHLAKAASRQSQEPTRTAWPTGQAYHHSFLENRFIIYLTWL